MKAKELFFQEIGWFLNAAGVPKVEKLGVPSKAITLPDGAYWRLNKRSHTIEYSLFRTVAEACIANALLSSVKSAATAVAKAKTKADANKPLEKARKSLASIQEAADAARTAYEQEKSSGQLLLEAARIAAENALKEALELVSNAEKLVDGLPATTVNIGQISEELLSEIESQLGFKPVPGYGKTRFVNGNGEHGVFLPKSRSIITLAEVGDNSMAYVGAKGFSVVRFPKDIADMLAETGAQIPKFSELKEFEEIMNYLHGTNSILSISNVTNGVVSFDSQLVVGNSGGYRTYDGKFDNIPEDWFDVLEIPVRLQVRKAYRLK